MRKAILIFACLILLVSSASSQRKGANRKPKTDPLTEIVNNTPSVPTDELLFDKEDYQILRHRTGWRLVGFSEEDSDKRQYKSYYDPQRVIIVRAGLKRAWIKYETSKEGILEKSSVGFEEYDCTESRYRTLAVTLYDKEGHPLGDADAAAPSSWKYVVPETLNERNYGVVCLGRKDNATVEMEAAAQWFRLGRQCEKKGNLQCARTWFQMALEQAPDNPKILAAIERVGK